LEQYTFGMLPHGTLYIWDVTTWYILHLGCYHMGQIIHLGFIILSFGKLTLGNYLTSFYAYLAQISPPPLLQTLFLISKIDL